MMKSIQIKNLKCNNGQKDFINEEKHLKEFILKNYYKIFIIFYVIVYITGFYFKSKNIFYIGFLTDNLIRLILKPKFEYKSLIHIIYSILCIGSMIVVLLKWV